MIDTTELYILILNYVTLTVIQGHEDAREENCCANYLPKLSMDLDGIWLAVEICWSVNLILVLSGLICSRKRIQCR